MSEDIYITTDSVENTPIDIIVSGDVDKSVYVSTAPSNNTYITASNNEDSPVNITVNRDFDKSIYITATTSSELFYPLNQNPSGYVNSGYVAGISGFLQYQIDNFSGSSNFDTGIYNIINEISGQIIATGSTLFNLINNLSGYVTGQDIYLNLSINNTGIYLYNTINSLSGSLNATGQYLAYEISNLNLWTGLSTGLFYPLNQNPANYLTGVDLSNYVLKSQTGIFATKSELVATGIDLQNQIYNLYNSGFITGFNSGDYVLKNQTGVFALNIDLIQSGVRLDGLVNTSSGYLQDQINDINNSGFITGVNLSGYVTGEVIRPQETGIFALQSDLYQTGHNLEFNINKIKLETQQTGSVFTYLSGNLSGITYDNQIQKSFTYNLDGTINTLIINYPNSTTLTKTFLWSGGMLQGITVI